MSEACARLHELLFRLPSRFIITKTWGRMTISASLHQESRCTSRLRPR